MSCLDGGGVLGELYLPLDDLGVVGAGGHEGVGGDVVQFRNLQTKNNSQKKKITHKKRPIKNNILSLKCRMSIRNKV